VPLSHNKPDGRPCDGQLTWGRAADGEIRRECALCGYREYWANKGRQWVAVTRSSSDKPGDTSWVDGK